MTKTVTVDLTGQSSPNPGPPGPPRPDPTKGKTKGQLALYYLELGFHVFPLAVGQKVPPAGFNWTPYQTAPPTRQQVEDWWTRNPDFNLAFATGFPANLLVVDLDPRCNSQDATSLVQSLPTGSVVKTPRGTHLYFRPVRPFQNKTNWPKPGVDVRADGGFVVAPGSTLSAGGSYSWAKRGKAQTLDPLALGGNPAEVYRQLQGGDLELSLPESPLWVSELLGGVAQGGRNQACARLAGYYLGKGLPLDVVTSTLLHWNQGNTPPLSTSEVQATVHSVAQAEVRQLAQEKADGERLTAKDLVGQSPNLEEPLEFLSYATYKETYGAEPAGWVVEDWLVEGSVVFCVAPPGTGKTWLLVDCALSVATGTPFLDEFPVCKPGPVLVVQQEDNHQALLERFETVLEAKYCGHPPPPGEVPVFFHTQSRLKLGDPKSVLALEAAVALYRPALVTVDPFYSVGNSEDYFAGDAANLQLLKRLRDSYGCSFLLAHHTTKGGAFGRERSLGSNLLNAALETGWQVYDANDTGKGGGSAKKAAWWEQEDLWAEGRPPSLLVNRHHKARKDSGWVGLDVDVSTVLGQRWYRPTVWDPRERAARLRAEAEEHKEGGQRHEVADTDFGAGVEGLRDASVKVTERLKLALQVAPHPLTLETWAAAVGKQPAAVTRAVSHLVKKGEALKEGGLYRPGQVTLAVDPPPSAEEDPKD